MLARFDENVYRSASLSQHTQKLRKITEFDDISKLLKVTNQSQQYFKENNKKAHKGNLKTSKKTSSPTVKIDDGRHSKAEVQPYMSQS